MMVAAVGMAFQTYQSSTQMVLPTSSSSSTATRAADDLLLLRQQRPDAPPPMLVGMATLVEERWLWLPAEVDASAHEQVLAHILMGEENNDYINNLTVTSHPLQDCNATSQVRIRIPPSTATSSTTTTSRWILQAMDGAGRDKRVGGDEFYIAYSSNSDTTTTATHGGNDVVTAVAFVEDRHDGSYALDFVTTPTTTTVLPFYNMSQTGRLTVHVSYTCGIGVLAPPAKDHWKTGAYMRLQASLEDVPRPAMRIFQPPRLPAAVDLANFTTVLGVGDSIMRQFFQNEDLPNHPPRKPNLVYIEAKGVLSTTTLPSFQKVLQNRRKELSKEGTALVLGFATWDIIITKDNDQQGPDFGDHLEACRLLIQNVTSRHPNATILWKSPIDFHLHRFQPNCLEIPWCMSQSRYMSSSRAQVLYHAQRKLMNELNIPFLELFEASHLSAEWTYVSDPRHFNVSFNDMAMDWFHSAGHHPPHKPP
jgi:hypothetical protein